MTKRMHVSLAMAAVALACQVVAQGASSAQSLYEQGIKAQNGIDHAIDLPAAQALLEQAAAGGNAMAMHRLGDMYHDGDGGCVKDFAKALEWYHKEADLDQAHPGQGALGMLEIGEAYAVGKGVAKDQAQAMEWFKKAAASAQIGAKKGELMGMLALSICNMEGKGFQKVDKVEAWQWAMASSRTANPWSEELMASMYFRGIGVPKDPETAVRHLLIAVQSGISEDMVDASLCFANGLGIKADPKTAFDWAEKAAERGSSRGMATLGRYYHMGLGVERSDSAAKEWYQKAIDKGDESAYGLMGDQFVMPGVNPRQPREAIKWYQDGIAKGDTYSMFQMAMLLTKDIDVVNTANNAANNTQAASLLRQAADLGSADAMNALGEMYDARQITGGTRQDARTWYQKAADTGLPAGMRNLGELIFEDGAGNVHNNKDDDPKLLAEAMKWLNQAAAAGDTEAMVDLGTAYQFGVGASQSMSVCATWYRKAAEAGNVRGMRSLGELYADGRSLGADYQSAFKWLKAASDRGDARATAGLGWLYELGVGLPGIASSPNGPVGIPTAKPDYLRAAQLYTKAYQGDDDGAGFRGMGHLCQEGLGVDRNLKQAADFYQKAVDRGDQRAMEYLGWMYELGQGVPQNRKIAYALFERSYKEFGSMTAFSWMVSHGPDTIIAPGTAPGRGGPGGG